MLLCGFPPVSWILYHGLCGRIFLAASSRARFTFTDQSGVCVFSSGNPGRPIWQGKWEAPWAEFSCWKSAVERTHVLLRDIPNHCPWRLSEPIASASIKPLERTGFVRLQCSLSREMLMLKRPSLMGSFRIRFPVTIQTGASRPNSLAGTSVVCRGHVIRLSRSDTDKTEESCSDCEPLRDLFYIQFLSFA
jgi:hypothetical protein